MRVMKIPKGRGKFRRIIVPNRGERRQLRLLLPTLNKLMAEHCDQGVVHGFCRGRNAVTNAAAHQCYKYTVTMDLRNFFDTVRYKHLVGKVCDALLVKCLCDPQGVRMEYINYCPQKAFAPNGVAYGWRGSGYAVDDVTVRPDIDNFAPRQGLPTSPAIANIAASDMDRLIVTFMQHNGASIMYTRYADDLTLSTNDPAVVQLILTQCRS